MKRFVLASGLVALSGCAGPAHVEPQQAVPTQVETPPATVTVTPSATPSMAAAIVPNSDAAQIGVASDALKRQAPQEALDAVLGASSPAAKLVRARAFLALGKLDEASKELVETTWEPVLAPLVAGVRGRVAWARNDGTLAVSELWPVVAAKHASAAEIEPTLTAALLASDPARLVDVFDVLVSVRKVIDPDAMSRLYGAKIEALTKLGKKDEARALAAKRFLEEPVSLLTPEAPPAGVAFTTAQILARAEVLQASHRSERVVAALTSLDDATLAPAERCQKHMALGLAHRKLRAYSNAETHLLEGTRACKDDPDRERRAMYLLAKVVSIIDGLRAIAIIDDFAKRFAGHTMVDDVLFWGGDLYQRRGRDKDAAAYYQRIDTLPKDDQCGEARWRLAWMAYRRGDRAAAKSGFTRLLSTDECKVEAFDMARAHYWLGKLAQEEDTVKAASEHFSQAFYADALGFYAQLALVRLQEVSPEAASTLPLHAPKEGALPSLCEGFLTDHVAYRDARQLLTQGLKSDAAVSLLSIAVPEQKVIAGSHAAAQGVQAKPIEATVQEDGCAGRDPKLLLALLLDQAGAYKDAHWRLRTDFADDLSRLPDEKTAMIWRAAYPLAWRDVISAAESESQVPTLFLQALAREESAFDPIVVSWAGAYGLTQLLLSTGKDAGRMLSPKVTVGRAEDLLDPKLNARLGGAMLSSLLRRYGQSPALALAAYNAGNDVASAWWKRHENDGLDVMAEEMTIQETRGYVKRVLRTYGIYRWLYEDAPPRLPVAMSLPKRATETPVP